MGYSSRYGWVRIGVYIWPFAEYRQITKGRYKGLYEILVNNNKYIVTADRIKSFPSFAKIDLSGNNHVSRDCHHDA